MPKYRDRKGVRSGGVPESGQSSDEYAEGRGLYSCSGATGSRASITQPGGLHSARVRPVVDRLTSRRAEQRDDVITMVEESFCAAVGGDPRTIWRSEMHAGFLNLQEQIGGVRAEIGGVRGNCTRRSATYKEKIGKLHQKIAGQTRWAGDRHPGGHGVDSDHAEGAGGSVPSLITVAPTRRLHRSRARPAGGVGSPDLVDVRRRSPEIHSLKRDSTVREPERIVRVRV